MYSGVLRDAWNSVPIGYLKSITPLKDAEYPAWVVRTEAAHGVAIPFPDSLEVREGFSGVDLYTAELQTGPDARQGCLVLMSSSPIESVPFATLCSEFISPGENGLQRNDLTSNPIGWWTEWKELLGNKNVDERVYDVLGELMVLKHLAERGIHAEWNGPDASTYDINCESR